MQTCDQTNQTAEDPSSLIPNQLITYTWQLQNLSDSPTVYVSIEIIILFTFSSYFDQSWLRHDNTNKKKTDNL